MPSSAFEWFTELVKGPGGVDGDFCYVAKVAIIQKTV
jgi:hypothetical protein